MSEALAEKPRRKTLKRVLIILAILILTLIIGVGFTCGALGIPGTPRLKNLIPLRIHKEI
ncbi:Uncharacterised protein [Rothia dentocariosa]|uniref:Uncharacterized protein n=1 Tax=Rothia dentocariosa TaxID=2047 RepID=A0A3S5BUF2_9MICC|nr:Uncharacterised protein [Rothia dentocariosa]